MSSALATPSNEYADPTVVANLMNEQRFGRMMIIAQTMASAALIPEHLLGKKKGGVLEYFTADEIRANCFLIVNQAFRWGMDPFAVMPETYVVGGKLAYQGKLIAGLVNSLANLEERLSYSFTGTKGTNDFTVTVSGKFKGATEPVTVQVSVGQAKTDNKMWVNDPEQKLVYTGATKWARRWCPEIILGILTDDDAEHIEMRDVTPRNGEPPKVITGGTTAPATAAEPEKKTRTRAAKESPAVEAAAVTLPTRKVMYAGIKEAAAAAEVSPATAEARFKEAGLLPRPIAETTDEELHAIYLKRLEILPPKEASAEAPAPEPIRAIYQNHQVSNSPEGDPKKWTYTKLRYTKDGEETLHEAGTYSTTVSKFLDTLEGGETILITFDDDGKTMKSVELAPNAGGDQ